MRMLYTVAQIYADLSIIMSRVMNMDVDVTSLNPQVEKKYDNDIKLREKIISIILKEIIYNPNEPKTNDISEDVFDYMLTLPIYELIDLIIDELRTQGRVH